MKTLRNKLRKEKHDVLFLQLTKCSSDKMHAIRSKKWRGILGIVIYARGMIGGISILWNIEALHLNNFRATWFSISADFQIFNSEVKGILTNVYVPSIITQKPTFLFLLDKEAQEMENRFQFDYIPAGEEGRKINFGSNQYFFQRLHT